MKPIWTAILLSLALCTKASALSISPPVNVAFSEDNRYVAAAPAGGWANIPCFVYVWQLDRNLVVNEYKVGPITDQLAIICLNRWYGPFEDMKLSGTRHTLTLLLPDGIATYDFVTNQRLSFVDSSESRDEITSAQLINGGTSLAIVRVSPLQDPRTTIALRPVDQTAAFQINTFLGPDGVGFSANGDTAAVWTRLSDKNSNVELRDVKSGDVKANINGCLLAGDNSSLFSKDGSEFVCRDNTWRQPLSKGFWLWSKGLGHAMYISGPKMLVDNFGAGLNRMALSPNGELVAISDRMNWVTIWRVNATGVIKKDAYVYGHRDAASPDMSAMTFSPDGQYLVFASGLGSVVVWDYLNGKCLNLTFPVLWRSQQAKPHLNSP